MDPNSENYSEYSGSEQRKEVNYNFGMQPGIDYQKFYMGGENQYQSNYSVQYQSQPRYANSTPYYIQSSQVNTPYSYPQTNFQQVTNAPQNTNYGMDKPWTRAMKDPTLIQRGTEIFVGNLSMETFENDIYEAFRDCGDIRLHKNVQTKKCYAFVRFASKEMLRAALDRNLMNLKGRKMKITKSNENSTIFIGNIRKNWSNADVEFHNCEKLEHFADPHNPNRNRGFCFVVFKNRNEAIKALNYVASKGGINIDGIPLTCDWADVVDEDDNNSKQIFVSGLDEEIEESLIREVFSAYGEITEIIMSKMHKTSKRKDLAFITFSTHEEAKRAADNYKMQYGRVENAQGEYEDNRVSPIGENVSVSLAFSQQAMQAKKKVKETRRTTLPMSNHKQNFGGEQGRGYSYGHQKGPHMGGNTGSIHGSGLHSQNNNYSAYQSNIPSISNISNMQSMQGMPSLSNTNLPNNFATSNISAMTSMQTMQNVPSMPSVPASLSNLPANNPAMLAMMNIINMNKNNMNISPTLMSQMMAACFESIINQNASTSSPSHPGNAPSSNPQTSPSFSSLNPTSTLTPLNPINQTLSSGPKLIQKRLKLNKKKRLTPLNNTNPSI